MKKLLLLAATIICYSNLTNAQPGRLDASFGNHGVVSTGLGKDYLYGTSAATKILLQSDGSMFVIQESLTKRHSNGSLDESFGIKGFVTDTGFSMSGAVIQPDGKIVVVGTGNKREDYYTGVLQSDFEVARYNSDGSLDSSFSEDGKQTTDFGAPGANYSPDRASSVAIQKDGKITVAGVADQSLALARYNKDGSPDNTFNGNGKLVNTTVFAIALAVQKDNKIVVAGTMNSDFAILRYNTEGSLDSTFSRDGIQTTDFTSANDIANAVAIQSDGKIVAGGSAVADKNNTYIVDFALARYNTDGSLDKSFSNDGKQTTSFGYTYYGIQSLAFQADGKIVAVGDSAGGAAFALARYNFDGSLDKSFSNDGKQTTTFGINEYGNHAYSVAIQSDGKIVAGGSASPYLALARYNTNGSPDNTFDNDGKLTDGIHAGNTVFKSIAVQKDGKAVSAGRTWNGSNFDFAIVRYNTDGSLDKTFSDDGKQTTDFGGKDDFANSVAIQSDGKIVVAGYTGKYDSSFFSIARYNTDGSLDNTFSNDGKQQTDFGFKVNQANAVTIQADGKIVVAGSAQTNGNFEYYETDFAIARYNSNGSPDNTFDADGKQTFHFTDEDGSVESFASSVAIQKDGKIVVGGVVSQGGLNSAAALLRFNTDGSLEKAYGNIGGDVYSSSIAIQKDGKVVEEAYFEYRGYGGIILSRYNTDGSLDKSFNGVGRKETDFNYGSPIKISSIALQADGKIVVAGTHLFRYNTNGSLDSTFGSNGIQPAAFYANAIAIWDNKLYAAAGSYNGTAARYLLDNSNTPPSVTLKAPENNATYLAPAAHIRFFAVAADKDGTISKVEFYNGTTLLHTETLFPYGFTWRNVQLGNYTLTAKAYDNSGNVTTSAPVHISVVPNKPPVVSITKPVNNRSFAAPGYIHLEAAASDTDGRVTNVKFYNGSTLLRTEYEYPYTYHWENVPVGTYTITAVATDNWGAHTTSAPVTIIVTSANAMIVSNKPSEDNKTARNDDLRISLYPNPATNIVNIYAKGLQQNKPATISVISASGIVMKTMQNSSSTQTQLNVSTLAKGVYTIKIISGDKILYKQFVKL